MTIGSPPPATTSVPRPALPPEFVMQRDGKDYVLYRGLLALGHQLGLRSIHVELVPGPGPDNGNVAICRARVVVGDQTFEEVGDASPANTGRLIAAHSIRMAATRAKARALRDAVNVGMTALEELGDGDEAPVAPTAAPPAPPGPGAMPQGPDGIVVGGRRFSREEVWRGYSQRRVAALNAKLITTSDRLAGFVPESRLSDMVAASQELRRRMAPPPELEPDPEEPAGERG